MGRKSMSRLLGFVCIATILLLGAKPQNEMFSKYKSVEAYEIRPGVLAMPRYTEDGQVCEVGVAKSSYSPEMIRIGGSFTRKEIDEIADELAPPEERGPKTPFFGTINVVTTQDIGTFVEHDDYENVSILVGGDGSAKCNIGDVVFTIRWTKRKCQ
jgi:hypothetical protein